MPQDIFIVRGHEILQSPAHQTADSAIQGGVVTGAERIGPVPHESPAFIGGSIAIVAHPEIGNHRIGERLHFLLQVRPEFVPLFPFAALHRFHVFHRRIIKVGGEVLFLRFRLDLCQDFRLFLGAVRLGGVFILFPQGGKYVAVLVGRGMGVHHRGCQ